MKILQAGAPKCGNFWLYQLLQQLLQSCNRDTSSFIEQQPIYELARHWDLNYPSQARIDVLEITDLQCSYRISSIFRMPISVLADYVARTHHVWTHSPICKRSGEVFRCFDRKLYIIRDPRDRAVSASRYYTSAYMQKYFPQGETDPGVFLEKHLEALMQEWVWHVFDHLRLREEYGLHLVFYEDLLRDFQATLGSLLAYLELEPGEAQRRELEEAVRFQTLKKENPNHLHTGKAGTWKQVLTEAQQETALRFAGPLMEFLGYEKGEEGLLHLRELQGDFGALKEAILRSQLQG